MNWKNHTIIGFVTVLVLVLFTYLNFDFAKVNWGFMIPVIFIYSIISDTDSKHSVARVLTWIIAFSVMGYAYYLKDFLLLGIVAISFLLLITNIKHRGLWHSILVDFIISIPLFIYFGFIYAIIGFIVAIQHSIADGMFKVA